MFGEEFIKGYKFCHGKYWSEDEKQLSKRMMGAWAYFAKVSFLPFVKIRMQCVSIWKYFRLEILDLKISKISSRANPHMSSQHQLINQLTLKTMKKILSSFTNDIFSRRVRKYSKITIESFRSNIWWINWAASSRSSLSQYYPMRNSYQITIGKTQTTLYNLINYDMSTHDC